MKKILLLFTLVFALNLSAANDPNDFEDLKKLEFSQKITENELTQKSFVQKFLQSIKQKMYSNQK